ncbi:YrrS family protein [Bacillaceae bacterium S4-13-56]
MENSNQDSSRVNRFEKKRRDTKMITLFGIVGSLLIIVLIFLFIFNDPPQDEALPATATNEEHESNNNAIEESGNEGMNDQEQEDNQPSDSSENTNQPEEQEDLSNEQVQENSDDPNVIETYANEAWEPIGTAQKEPHTPSFDKESVDWKELRQAIGYAVELRPDDLILWWVTHGEAIQERVATVTNLQQDEDKIYRVTLKWIENQGYKPIIVERLKENDKKENTSENEQDTEVE